MWPVHGTLVPDRWAHLEPLKVLYEFDGPRIFTCTGPDGATYLAYQCGEDAQKSRFILAPFDEADERALTEGNLSVRQALDRPGTWLVETGLSGSVIASWQVRIADLPAEALPKPGALLWPHLRSVIDLNGSNTMGGSRETHKPPAA